MSNVVEVKSVSKKFCRHQRRTLLYGAYDIVTQTFIGRREQAALRKGEFWALQNISFEIPQGKSLGIIGANGSGKTTILKIISGLLIPDAGQIKIRGKIVSLFAKGAGFNSVLSGRENIVLNLMLLGLSSKEAAGALERVIEFSELPEEVLNAPIKTYSSGMIARLGFSCAVNSQPEVLIIDEALAVGDIKFRMKCYRKLSELRRKGTSFIMVSHSLNSVVANCDLGLYLQAGKIRGFGEVRSVVKQYENDIVNPMGNTFKYQPLSANTFDYSTGGAIKIVAIKVASEKDGMLLSGGPGKIELFVNSNSFFEDVNIWIIIRDRSGDLGTVLNLCTSTDRVQLNLKPGLNIINVTLPICILRPGLYDLKISISIGSQHNVQAAIESFPFKVVEGREMIECLFYQPHEWMTYSPSIDRA